MRELMAEWSCGGVREGPSQREHCWAVDLCHCRCVCNFVCLCACVSVSTTVCVSRAHVHMFIGLNEEIALHACQTFQPFMQNRAGQRPIFIEKGPLIGQMASQNILPKYQAS